MNIHAGPIPKENDDNKLDAVRARVEYKMRDYANYNFTPQQSSAINIFFDLAQEFDDIDQVHLLPAIILHLFFQYKAELYLLDAQSDLVLMSPSVTGSTPDPPQLTLEISKDKGRYCIPVCGRDAIALTKTQHIVPDQNLMGVLAVYTDNVLKSHELLFLNKFANRLGFCLHTKILAERNSRHIHFLRKLAHDIGHNIITPNLRLKFQLNQLEKHKNTLKTICQQPADEATLQEVRILQRKLDEQTKTIMGTFNNNALFMESLFRQSHFDLGHYVLRRARLDIAAMVVMPQFERYRPFLEERGLTMEENIHLAYPPSPCMVQADLGMISQVMANFIANAGKYCTPKLDGFKEIRCSIEAVPGAFENGQTGVKVSVFSSGPNIPPDEAPRLFEDNYRASNAKGKQGTGHGLFFVREIIAEHAGKTGYEPLPTGNNFYFMLPLAQ